MTTLPAIILLATALAAPPQPVPQQPRFTVPDGGGELVDRIAAVVGGEVITLAELERAVSLHRGGPFPGLSLSCGLPEHLREERVPEALDEETVPGALDEDAMPAPVEEEGVPGPVDEDAVPDPVDEEAVPEPLEEDSAAGARADADDTGGDGLRARVLDCLIDATLVFRHVRRFPQPGITADEVDAAYDELVSRFASVEAFEQELRRWHFTPEEVRRDLDRQLHVQAYIEDRFRSFVDISPAEVEAYYHDELAPAMRARDARLPPLEEVEEQIRQLLREREVNRRIEAWLADLRRRTEITRYVW